MIKTSDFAAQELAEVEKKLNYVLGYGGPSDGEVATGIANEENVS